MNARDLRLLFLVASAVVFVDTMFYAAVVPLLPTLTHELHLSKASAGVLTAGYAAGTLVGSIPGGMLAARAGPRATIYVGLFLMGSSSLAFGFLDNIAGLDAARFVQGFGGACTWSGSLAWLIGEVDVGRRGSAIGGALAAGIAGALFGPVIGTLAHALGRAPVFSAVAVVAVGLAVAVALLPAPSAQPDLGPAHLWDQLRRPAIVLGMWLTALPAIASGVVNVLGPLRLSALGASAVGIGATFLIAAGAEALVSPAVGRVSDQRGRMFPLRIGLAAAAIVLVCFPLSDRVVVVAAVVVLTAVTLGSFWAPAMAMLSDAAEAGGLSQGYAMALINLAWAGGQIVGAAGGGTLAKATGDGLPFALSSAMCAATLGLVLVRPVRTALAR
ncbi:MAG TPA: MFS transporter [Solirubrobacteraceae bacterium]|nr:MFS transporter [Solirubrobacteraceae bacterium]